MSSEIGLVSLAFLFTDVEGSTSRWEKNEPAMREAMARHDALLRSAVTACAGRIVKTSGDGLYAVFPNVPAALRAAERGQARLMREDFGAAGGIKVRMAIHAGLAEARDDDYFGPPLNRVARLVAAGHGGQILLTATAAEQALPYLPAGAALRDLGRHRLKDLAAPEQVYQLLAPALPDEFPVLRSLDSMPNNLPLQATSFVGRDGELAELARLLGQHRLVTMLGSGGIGKTRLALQAGAEALGRFGDGVWLVELAPLMQPHQIAEAVAGAIGFNAETITTASVANYLKYLRVLLILDNCEHLIDGAAALADAVMKACPSVTVLATSREALRVSGEQIFPVPTLGVPEHAGALSPAGAMDHAAVRLFVDRAAMSSPGFRLDERNAPAIGAICRRLDGIALAIELAAARSKLLSPAEMLGRLQGRFEILSGGSRTAMPRQQTLSATIAWSFELLSPLEQRALCRLAVFEGSFSLQTATEVIAVPPIAAHDVFDLVAAVADKSMISRLAGDAGGSRYRMLETTRQFCFEKLEVYGETDATRRHLANAMIKLYENATQSWPAQHRDDWCAAYAPDFGNLSASIEWALDADTALGLELISRAGEVCEETANTSVRRRWFERAAPLIGPATPPLIEARLRSGAAALRGWGSGAGWPSVARALELYRGLHDVQELASCLAFMIAALRLDGVEDALCLRACEDELMPMLAGLKRDKRLSYILRTLGVFTPDPRERLRLLQQSAAIDAEFADKSSLLWNLCDTAKTYFQLGDLAKALEMILQGVPECREWGDPWLIGRYFCEIVAFGCMAGRLAEARAAAPVALASFRSFDYQMMIGYSIERVALLAACEGRMTDAARLAGYCKAQFAAGRWQLDALQTAVQARLAALLEQLPPGERATLMRQGAAWGAEYAYDAALAIVA